MAEWLLSQRDSLAYLWRNSRVGLTVLGLVLLGMAGLTVGSLFERTGQKLSPKITAAASSSPTASPTKSTSAATPSASPIVSGDPFAKALALARAGMITEALTESKNALASSPPSTLPPELQLLVVPDRDDPFNLARAYARAGFDDKARDEAAKQLAAHPERRLPPEIQLLVVPNPEDPFNVALAYARMGLDDKAREETTKELGAHPERSLPPELVRLVVPASDDPFNVARAYARAGFDDKAKEEALKQLASHPERSLPPELAYLTQRPGEVFPDGVFNPPRAWSLIANPRTWLEVLARDITLGLVGVLSFIAVILPLLRRSIAPRYRIEAFEGDPPAVGRGIARLLEDDLRSQGAEGGGPRLEFLAAADAPVALPDSLKTLPPAFGWLSALLALFPNNTRVVSGTLQGRGPDGVGLSMRLTSPDGKVVSSVTLWEADFDPLYSAPSKDADVAASIAAYQMLGFAGASWLLFQLRARDAN